MVHIGMKRQREAEIDGSITSMSNCLMLLARSGDMGQNENSRSGRVFECKTCNRQFPSFQALGGHRASHKKPRLSTTWLDSNQQSQSRGSRPKPKTHECSICGLEFAIGQALGGHMRRHRAAALGETVTEPTLSLSLSMALPIVKRANSRRITLDLNLTPLENGLDFPKFHCYL